jgi:hypothetical protein
MFFLFLLDVTFGCQSLVSVTAVVSMQRFITLAPVVSIAGANFERRPSTGDEKQVWAGWNKRERALAENC